MDQVRKAVIYTRVSTANQATDGVSLDAQLSRCRAHAEARGLTIIGEYQDAGISGRADPASRPGYEAARVATLDTHGTTPGVVLVVYSLSRLCRSVRHLYELVDSGLQIQSVTEPIDTTTAAGRMIVGLLSVMAQFEAELTAERTATALRHLQSDGKHVGRPPYGWRVGPAGLLEQDPTTHGAVKEIEELHRNGASAAAIARSLGGAAAGWHETKVRRILRRNHGKARNAPVSP